jgi:VIT1/CCC1 family predicted Fe2+/Mn2+ transporter
MTQLRERPVTEITRTPTRKRTTEKVVGILGLLAAAVGAWMYFVPADWFLGGLAEAWHLGMFTGAGALLAAAFGLFAYEVRKDEERWTTAAITAAVVATLALAAAVTFAVIWIV